MNVCVINMKAVNYIRFVAILEGIDTYPSQKTFKNNITTEKRANGKRSNDINMH